MKKCVNSSCQHELEDYQTRCPYCGFPQEVKPLANVPDSASGAHSGEPEEWEVLKERNSFVTVWLYLALIINALSAAGTFFPKAVYGGHAADVPVVFFIISGLLCVVNIFAIVQLLQWKKMGFILICASCFANAIIKVLASAMPIGVLGILVWYFVLQLKKNGKSCWEQLV